MLKLASQICRINMLHVTVLVSIVLAHARYRRAQHFWTETAYTMQVLQRHLN